jgi:hypothetical protein
MGTVIGIGIDVVDLSDSVNPTYAGSWTDHFGHDATVTSYTEGPYAGREIVFVCLIEEVHGCFDALAARDVDTRAPLDAGQRLVELPVEAFLRFIDEDKGIGVDRHTGSRQSIVQISECCGLFQGRFNDSGVVVRLDEDGGGHIAYSYQETPIWAYT